MAEVRILVQFVVALLKDIPDLDTHSGGESSSRYGDITKETRGALLLRDGDGTVYPYTQERVQRRLARAVECTVRNEGDKRNKRKEIHSDVCSVFNIKQNRIEI